MYDIEARAVRQLYLNNWVSLGFIAVLLAICLALTDFSVQFDSALVKGLATAAAFAIGAHYTFLRHWTRLSYTLGSMAQLGLLYSLAAPLTFVAAAADLPLLDGYLASADRMLGLNWQSYFFFVNRHPWLIPYLYVGYAMILWPAIGIPIALGATRHHRRLQQFFLASTLTVIVTAGVSALLPAIGTYHEYGIALDISKFNPSGYIAQLERLPYVRDGSLRILSSATLGGIITFPSFHAATAVLSMWALWSVWWLRPLALIANIGMLIATPLVGGHYFVDVFAGIFVAMAAIAAARLIGEWVVRPRETSAECIASAAA
jgi:hypothetical protein